MTEKPDADQPRKRAIALAAFLVIVSAAHFVVSVGTHGEHVAHVALGGLFLIGIVAASLWFGFSGGVMASLAVSVTYLAHILTSWRGQPMENANQYATIGVYLMVGSVTGILVERQWRERARHLEAQRRAHREALLQALASLSNALGARDGYTEEHSERVARLAEEMGRRRGLGEERLDVLRLSSLVHDIGKIGVRDDILLKPDRLSSEERTLIERHPAVAARILRPIRGAEEIAEIVLSHHECPDGTGYPKGLTGNQIPLEARILRVADVFSALTDPRSYKPALDRDEVIRWMRGVSGTKLDAESVATLEDLVEEEASKTGSLHGELVPVGRRRKLEGGK
jgi:putative nucleotidyltransferase with HDIG domain